MVSCDDCGKTAPGRNEHPPEGWTDARVAPWDPQRLICPSCSWPEETTDPPRHGFEARTGETGYEGP